MHGKSFLNPTLSGIVDKLLKVSWQDSELRRLIMSTIRGKRKMETTGFKLPAFRIQVNH
jgi:hypothetical protein